MVWKVTHIDPKNGARDRAPAGRGLQQYQDCIANVGLDCDYIRFLFRTKL